MSMEHIFRNLMDIRVFDLFSSCQFDEKSLFDIDNVLELLDYPDREIIQIEDSVKHLVDEGILIKTYNIEKIPCYYIDVCSDVVVFLINAVLASSFKTAKELEKGE